MRTDSRRFQDAGDQFPALGDARESFLSTLVIEEEVVGGESQGGEDGRVEVFDALGLVGGAEADFVGGADRFAGADAAAGEPDVEAVGVVVAARLALFHRGATEFAGPDDEGGIEEAASFEIRQEGRDRLIGLGGIAAVVIVAAVVPVPAEFVDGVVDLDEADPFLDEASCEEAHPSVFGFGGIGVVDRVGVLGFACLVIEFADIDRFGLHAVGQFVRRDAAIEFEQTGAIGGVAAVELLCEVDRRTLDLGQRIGWGQVKDGGPLVAELGPLERGGEEAVAPIGRAP